MGKVIRIPDETRQAVATDYLAGMQTTKIADKHNISVASVYNIIDEVKMNDLKEKEPAAAATAADSVSSKDDNSLAHTNNSTKAPESQALRGVEVIGLMQTMLIGIEENFGDNAEVMSLRADSEQAHIMFRYGGKDYALSFGLAF